MMKAIAYRQNGEVDVLTEIELPTPEPGPNDLLVRVKAVSVNPVDVKRRRWEGPDAASGYRVLGYDASGVVEDVGKDVTLFKPGDQVFYAGAMDRPGTNSELHLVDERIVGPKPRSLTHAEAAALPLTSITAWEMLFDRMKVNRLPGREAKSLLIVNGAGGVGSMLIQLANQLTDLTVIATASRPESVKWVQGLGAKHVANHNEPLDDSVRALGFAGVDYIAAVTTTPKSGPEFVRTINPQGHITFIDNFEGSILPFKPKSVTISWEMMFTRSLFQTADMDSQHRILSEVSTLVDSGALKTTLNQLSKPISAEELRRAHTAVESGRTIGKVVVESFASFG
jgi:zinc-binding alcohol dehydrogenase family protein